MTAPDPSVLLDLAERCERATGRDRELDLRICSATTGNKWRWYSKADETITWSKYGENAYGNPICSLDAFTGSIDAAMTLVPEGRWLTLDRYIVSDVLPAEQRTWRVWIKVLVGDVEGDGPCGVSKQFGFGPTPALALCAAALRARSTDTGGK